MAEFTLLGSRKQQQDVIAAARRREEDLKEVMHLVHKTPSDQRPSNLPIH